MFTADYIVDIGPGAGEHGGEVVAVGNAAQIMKCRDSITGAYLSGRMKIPVPKIRKQPTGFLKVVGASENNLKNIDVQIPLGVMTCVTGVSGSGKSSLVNEILYKHLAKALNRARTIPGKHKRIEGLSFWTRSLTSINRPLEGRPDPSLPPTQECLTRSAICLPAQRMPRRRDIKGKIQLQCKRRALRGMWWGWYFED